MATKKSSRKSAVKKTCEYCGQAITARGYGTHVKACGERSETQRKQGPEKKKLLKERAEHAAAATAHVHGITPSLGEASMHNQRSFIPAASGDDSMLDNDALDSMLDNDLDNGMDAANAHTVQLDDIKIEYHPKSGMREKVFRFHDYTDARPAPSHPPDPEPWKPFRTRLDFEIADLLLDTRMNKKQSSRLLSLIHRCIKDPQSFTLSDSDDLDKVWSHARAIKSSGFVKKSFKVNYKAKDLEYEVSTRPLWDWCLEVIGNRDLIHHFRWDAERHFKFNGEKFERFIDEPWTADDWWNIQSALPDHASPLFIIIYADKTRLSSFGTVKGYPVVARIANLPSNIRNSNGAGGGRLVGWLPIVDEDPGETGKKGFVNLKRIVWHRAFQEILDTIKRWGKVGYHASCGDDIARWLFPLLFLLLSDFEEQCIMALIRGFGSYAPCPVCLIPGDQLANLSINFPLRTKESMIKYYQDAQDPDLNASEREQILKGIGLRDVENAFWDLSYFDPYQALSWDRLHAYHGGLFSDHIWSEFKRVVDELGKKQAKQIDRQVDNIPRWSGLNHFPAIMKQEFTDGSKYEDIAKVIMFTSHNVLSKDESPAGFILLQVLRSYLELDMFASLSVQTESTLEFGKKELKIFEQAIQKYREIYPAKSWNFPKMHSHVHLFADILRKGVSRIYNTKPNEKAHSPLKSFYQLMTNFKAVAEQILRLNENDVVATIIREELAELDAYIEQLEHEMNLEDTNESTQCLIGNEHVSLGSPLPPLTIGLAEHRMFGIETNPAFQNFRKRLSKSLTLIHGKNCRLSEQDEIHPYQLLRVNYESKIDWRTKANLLRVNPKFHNRPRYDFALIDAGAGTHFVAQLLYVFGVFAGGEDRYMALILPMDESIPRAERVASDRVLRFARVRSRPKSKAAFIDIDSIVRGIVVVPSNDNEVGDEYLIFDVLDEDIWWRMKSTRLATNVRLT